MKIIPLAGVKAEDIIEVLENSGIVILPFDTCYGVSCNPEDKVAVAKLLKYKVRPEGKAISISVSDKDMAQKYVEINDTANTFYDRFLPGPYTVISNSNDKVVDSLEAENSTLGIRIPDNQWILDLIAKYGKGITSTSANQHYQKTPYSVQDILDNLSEKSKDLIDLIIDGGRLPYNPPSTVIDTTKGDMKVLRKGNFLPEGSKVNEFISKSEEDTIQFAQNLFEKYKDNLEIRPIIFALQGDLGAGKTHFTKGIAKSLHISHPIQSPTFILSREYKSLYGNMLYHIDTWRLESEDDFERLEITNMLSPRKHINQDITNNIIVIEWADKIIDKLRSIDSNHKIIWIEIAYDQTDSNKRLIKWSE